MGDTWRTLQLAEAKIRQLEQFVEQLQAHNSSLVLKRQLVDQALHNAVLKVNNQEGQLSRLNDENSSLRTQLEGARMLKVKAEDDLAEWKADRAELIAQNEHLKRELQQNGPVRPSPFILAPDGQHLECLFCGVDPRTPHEKACTWEKAIRAQLVQRQMESGQLVLTDAFDASKQLRECRNGGCILQHVPTTQPVCNSCTGETTFRSIPRRS